MVKISSVEELENWLEKKPMDWAQVIVARIILRLLPFALNDRAISQDSSLSLILFRASSLSWATHLMPYSRGSFVSTTSLANEVVITTNAADTINASTVCNSIAESTAYNANFNHNDAVVGFALRAAETAAINVNTLEVFWKNIVEDCKFLESNNTHMQSMMLASETLFFFNNIPISNEKQWIDAKIKLLELDKNFIHWTNWYERRLIGYNSAFDIPYDLERVEDQGIIEKLFLNEKFNIWTQGAEHVNASLDIWLNEARQRAQERYEQENHGIDEDVLDEENIPSQETSVTSFAPRDDGKIDRAPATPDNRLRDVPDARQSYADLRKKVEKLRQEGQRLGGNLKEALDDFLSSLPEDFEQALAYNIWRDGTNLREIFELHEIAIQSPDYDPDKLENAIALRLKGVLSLFNNFAFDDDGLRQRDERIPPQKEIEHAVQETRIAQPIINTAQKENALSTQQVLDDLKALAKTEEILKDQDIPDNIYQKQELVENNKVTRNFVAALITVARGVLKEVKKSASNIRDGAEKELGKTLVKTSKYLVILEYIKRNASELKQFVITAYTNPTLVKLIDDVVELVSKSF